MLHVNCTLTRTRSSENDWNIQKLFNKFGHMDLFVVCVMPLTNTHAWKWYRHNIMGYLAKTTFLNRIFTQKLKRWKLLWIELARNWSKTEFKHSSLIRLGYIAGIFWIVTFSRSRFKSAVAIWKPSTFNELKTLVVEVWAKISQEV